HLDRLPVEYRVNIEGEALIITITSPDYTEGKFEDQVYGDILLERGQGWEMEVSYDFTVEDLLRGIGESEGLVFRPYLVYRSYHYPWPDAATVQRNLELTDIIKLLDILLTGEFPNAFFREDEYVL